MLIRISLAVLASWVVLASVLGMQSSTWGATYFVTPVFDKAYLPDLSAEIPTATPYRGPAVMKIDYYLDYDGPPATFGAVVFDIELDGISTSPLLPGYQPFNPTVDTNGNLPGGGLSLFATNGDLGVLDLKNVTAGIAAGLTTDPAVDPRLRVGKDPWNLLGSTYLQWDGASYFRVSAMPSAGGMRDPATGELIVDRDAELIGFEFHNHFEGGFTTIPGFGSTLDFGSGPEARTLQLETFDGGPFGAKVLGAEIMGEDASLFSVTPFAPYDFVGGERFNIDIHFNGTTVPGDYSAQLALHWSEGGATETSLYPLIAHVSSGATIPEPSTFALASLGLLASALLFRRPAVKL